MRCRFSHHLWALGVAALAISGCGGGDNIPLPTQNIDLTITGIDGYNGPSSISSQNLNIEVSEAFFIADGGRVGLVPYMEAPNTFQFFEVSLKVGPFVAGEVFPIKAGPEVRRARATLVSYGDTVSDPRFWEVRTDEPGQGTVTIEAIDRDSVTLRLTDVKLLPAFDPNPARGKPIINGTITVIRTDR